VSLILGGFVGGDLILQGYGTVSEAEISAAVEEVLGGGGKRRKKRGLPEPYPFFQPKPKKPAVRSKNADKFIKEVTKNIERTGVVKKTRLPYDPVKNRRYKVPKRTARKIAYKIAKNRGMKVGKFR